MRTILFVALLSTGCTPSLWSQNATCMADGFEIQEQFRHSCAQYQEYVSKSWALVTSRGWVSESDKSDFRAIPIRVWDTWSFFCNSGELASGCYFNGDHIETDVTLGALPHEWLHHADWLRSVRDDRHQSWDVRGAETADTSGRSIEGRPCLNGSWCDATDKLCQQQYYDYLDANPYD